MQIQESEICQLTESIWASILGMDVERSRDSFLLGHGYYSGTVRIDGAWKGEVALDCSPDLARTVAGVMFGAEPESTAPDEIEDALGELTNMLGGTLKALLPGPSQLSLPKVALDREPAECGLRISEARLVGDVTFLCQGMPLRVTLLEAPAPVEQAAGDRSATARVEAAARGRGTSPAGSEPEAPTELAGAGGREESRWIAPDVQGILVAAVEEAERTVCEARAEAARLEGSGPIAALEAEAMIARAEAQAEAIRSAARRYAEALLDRLQERLDEITASIEKSRQWLRSE